MSDNPLAGGQQSDPMGNFWNALMGLLQGRAGQNGNPFDAFGQKVGISPPNAQGWDYDRQGRGDDRSYLSPSIDSGREVGARYAQPDPHTSQVPMGPGWNQQTLADQFPGADIGGGAEDPRARALAELFARFQSGGGPGGPLQPR